MIGHEAREVDIRYTEFLGVKIPLILFQQVYCMSRL